MTVEKLSIYHDIVHVLPEAIKEKVAERLPYLLVEQTNLTRGAKNPYSGSYESQESSINLSFKTTDDVDKLDVILMSYASQWSFLTNLLIVGEIKKDKYITKKKELIETTIFIITAMEVTNE